MLAHARGSTILHPSATCMMAPSANPVAVVDHELRVHGISSPRGADASITPTEVSGNTNAAFIMVGEKCAEMMLAR
jgi:choline dehydrogenase-like flavoprotein